MTRRCPLCQQTCAFIILLKIFRNKSPSPQYRTSQNGQRPTLVSSKKSYERPFDSIILVHVGTGDPFYYRDHHLLPVSFVLASVNIVEGTIIPCTLSLRATMPNIIHPGLINGWLFSQAVSSSGCLIIHLYVVRPFFE